MVLFCFLFIYTTFLSATASHNILMITMGGTRSHKVPFIELANGLSSKGHNVTLYSAFPEDTEAKFAEVIPMELMYYVNNFTNRDLVGPRILGTEPISLLEAFIFGYKVCEAALSDPKTLSLLSRPADVLILDGAYPECAAGLVFHFNKPFILLNTVGFYTGSMSLAGSPAIYSVTPYFGFPHSDDMNLWERFLNAIWSFGISVGHKFLVLNFIDPIIRSYLGDNTPSAHEVLKNVSFILQNGHFSVSYPRPYLPGVAEIACMHCKPTKPLPLYLEEFVTGGLGNGFVYVSMGSSVRAVNMPAYLRQTMIRVFSELPFQILWKWEADPENIDDLPKNVLLGKWLPQQDLLGHPKIKAFVSHGGLLSLYESAYHAVPVVAMPVFFDHECNAHKAEKDGYALKLHLKGITYEKFLGAIMTVIDDPKYKINAILRSTLLKDQPEPPLERAIYWIEYVLRHSGAYHLQSPARNLNFFQYYMIDILIIIMLALLVAFKLLKLIIRLLKRTFLYKNKKKFKKS
uniref:UDP-glucuronosyltransferase n=1 Tax=Clastoptera arizonana TaxID=38151 RepID=A0A1B6DDM3_9HEMI